MQKPQKGPVELPLVGPHFEGGLPVVLPCIVAGMHIGVVNVGSVSVGIYSRVNDNRIHPAAVVQPFPVRGVGNEVALS